MSLSHNVHHYGSLTMASFISNVHCLDLRGVLTTRPLLVVPGGISVGVTDTVVLSGGAFLPLLVPGDLGACDEAFSTDDGGCSAAAWVVLSVSWCAGLLCEASGWTLRWRLLRRYVRPLLSSTM